MRVIIASAAVHLKQLAVERVTYIFFVAQPLFIATAGIFMLRHQPGFAAIYVVVGTALSGLATQALLFNSGVISQDRWLGTLEYLATAPAALFHVALGRTVGMLAFSIISAGAAYVVASLLFGYRLTIDDPVGFTVSAVLTVVALTAVGTLLAPLAFRWIPVGMFLTGLEYPVYILCGFLFPIVLLPNWLQPLSYALPPYWGAAAMHATSSGAVNVDHLWLYWVLLLVTSAAAFALAHWLFGYFLERARRQGTLGAV